MFPTPTPFPLSNPVTIVFNDYSYKDRSLAQKYYYSYVHIYAVNNNENLTSVIEKEYNKKCTNEDLKNKRNDGMECIPP